MEQRQDPRSLSGHARLVPRRGGTAKRAEPLRDPRVKAAARVADAEVARAGRRAALTLAAVGAFWIVTTAVGTEMGWPTRVRALFDLLALAGFGWALYLTWQVWRLRRADRG